MIKSGLLDNQNNPICQGQHFLLTIPDEVFNSDRSTFYGSQLGKDMKKLSARHYLVYIVPTDYLVVRLATCFLKDDLTPFTLADEEVGLDRDAANFAFDGIDINTVDKTDPAISFADDAFTFVRYLVAKGWLVYEPNPTVDLSKIKTTFID